MVDLARFCCQNPDCTATASVTPAISRSGRYGKLNHIRLLYCNAGKDRFSERKGTAFFHCHLPEEKARSVLDGCDPKKRLCGSTLRAFQK